MRTPAEYFEAAGGDAVGALALFNADQEAEYQAARAVEQAQTNHIRTKAPRSAAARGWGTDSTGQFRRRLGYEPKVTTLCGAAPTTTDVGWGEVRSTKSAVHVKCAECVQTPSS